MNRGRHAFFLLCILLMLSGCIRPETARPRAEAPATADLPGVAVAQQLVRQWLHLDPTTIRVVSAEAVEWPDSCLGIVRPDVLCAAVITPGYKIVLEVQGQTYEFHTDVEGVFAELAAAPEPVVGERIITWTGVDSSGFCVTARIGADGIGFGPCGGVLAGGQFASTEQHSELTTFAGQYASFTGDSPAGGIDFVGYGSATATPAEQRMLTEWARVVASEAQLGRSSASLGLALVWHREGGIAGFCDDISVYLTGEVYVSSCASEPTKTVAHFRLNTEQLATLYSWVDELQAFEVEQKDPAAADAMTIQLVFTGSGQSQATAADQEAMTLFAQELWAQAQ